MNETELGLDDENELSSLYLSEVKQNKTEPRLYLKGSESQLESRGSMLCSFVCCSVSHLCTHSFFMFWGSFSFGPGTVLGSRDNVVNKQIFLGSGLTVRLST